MMKRCQKQRKSIRKNKYVFCASYGTKSEIFGNPIAGISMP